MRAAVRKALAVLQTKASYSVSSPDNKQRPSAALKAVVAAVTVLEDDDAFNAGYGSVLNIDGQVEMDAAVMEGNNLRFGAVGGIGKGWAICSITKRAVNNILVC